MERRISICHVSTVHHRHDDRIFLKQCCSLSDANFQVFLVIKADRDEVDQGVNIVAIKTWKGRLGRMFFGIPQAFFRSLQTKSKVYHLHDPELLPLALLYKLMGKKVIFDSHEDVPKQIKSKAWIGSLWMRNFVSLAYSIVESFFVLFCNKVISVTPEITDRFPQSKRVLIRNFPILDLAIEKQSQANDIPILIYAGGLSRIRGIKEVISAMELLQGRAKLWLLGSWSDSGYMSECMAQNGWESVTYYNQVKPNEVYNYFSKCDIGLALLYPEENYLMSLPVKAFEYMAAGLPIIMSDFPYWRSNFSYGAIFVNPKNAQELAQAIEQLVNDKSLREQLGKEALIGVKNFSWNSESKTLINIYVEILS